MDKLDITGATASRSSCHTNSRVITESGGSVALSTTEEETAVCACLGNEARMDDCKPSQPVDCKGIFAERCQWISEDRLKPNLIVSGWHVDCCMGLEANR